MLFDTQRHNPITGDTQLSPASFGLSMKDVDAAWSLNLKSALNSWGLSLTADHYRELQQIQEKKYWALDATSWILSWPLIPAVNMTGKAPWLYATQSHLWFWNGDKWVSYIGNNGAFQFKGNDDNYIQWNPLTSTLEIKGALQMWDSNLSAEEYIDNLKTEIDKEIEKVDRKIDSKTFDFNLHDAEKQWDGKYKLFLNSQNLRSFTLPPRYSGVYMSRDWLYAYNNGNATFELNANTGDALFRGKVYASGGEFTGSITSTATITGGRIVGGSFKTKLSGRRVTIEGDNLTSWDDAWLPRVQITSSSIFLADSDWNVRSEIKVTGSEIAPGWYGVRRPIIRIPWHINTDKITAMEADIPIIKTWSLSINWQTLDQYIDNRIRNSSWSNLESRITQLENRINSLNSGPTDYVQYITIIDGELRMTDNRWNVYKMKPGQWGYVRNW